MLILFYEKLKTQKLKVILSYEKLKTFFMTLELKRLEKKAERRK